MICKEKILIIDDRTIHVRPIKGARGLCLRLTPKGEIRLSVPYFCLERQIKTFLEAHKSWLEAHLSCCGPRHFIDGMSFHLGDLSLTIRHVPQARRGVWQEGKMLYVSGDAEFLHRRVCGYVKRATRQLIQREIDRLIPRLHRYPTGFSLKDTYSCWGSCSSTGHLNFCWKIGLTPGYVIEYLVAHELAHLEHMNHGPAFWAAVGQLTDHRADAEIWLRRHGREVLQFD